MNDASTDRRIADPRYLSAHARRNRALVLLVATLLLPGSAQIAAGRPGLGRVVLRSWLALLGTVLSLGVLYLVSRRLLFDLLSQGWALLLLSIVLVGSAAVWVLLFIDAWRLGRPPMQSMRVRRTTASATAALVLLTGLPLLYAAHQVSVGRSVLAQVLGGNVESAASHGRYNVLLMGGDAGSDRIGVRPDSISLVSIDADNGRTVLFSFPRNMQNIPFPDSSPMHQALPQGFDCGDECLLNAVYTYATEHRGIYGPDVKDPGAQATMDAVSAISGLKVNYFVLMDLQGFRDLVDAMGGVRIDVKQALPIGDKGAVLKVGSQKLDGYHALWYARSRHADSDYARMARQRCVMTAMLDQLDPATVVTKFQRLAVASTGLVTTTLPQSELGTFIDLALKAKSQELTSVQFVPPVAVPSHPDYPAIRELVRTTIEASQSPGATSQQASTSTRSSSSSTGKGTKASSKGTGSSSTKKSTQATPVVCSS